MKAGALRREQRGRSGGLSPDEGDSSQKKQSSSKLWWSPERLGSGGGSIPGRRTIKKSPYEFFIPLANFLSIS